MGLSISVAPHCTLMVRPSRKGRSSAQSQIAHFMPVAVAMLALTDNAHAHAFGARYELPISLGLYLGAAGLAVAASFLLMAFLPARITDSSPKPTIDCEQRSHPNWRNRAWLFAMRITGIALLLVVIAAAFTGQDSATGNFATVFVWIVWWVGLIFFQALVMDVWSSLNPWRFLAQIVQKKLSGSVFMSAQRHRWHYPPRLEYWPAIIFFFAFAWLELVSDLGEQPTVLGVLIIAYTITTVIAATIFGVERWFSRADPFAVVLQIFGRFAPFTICNGPRLRIPGSGLLVREPVPFSLVILVMMLLATVSFDGFAETPLWAALLEWLAHNEALRSPLLMAQGTGIDLLKLIQTMGLLIAIIIFFAMYLLVAWLVDRCCGAPQGLRASAGTYVLSLVPIAIGYHLAHYLSYLLIAGQLIIPLASDPFALGWNLFGTRGYGINIAIVDARFVWYTAIFTIVGGHVIAVYLAHSMALRVYGQRSRALRSQLPMLVLMVGYTMTSLWILSQPIVKS